MSNEEVKPKSRVLHINALRAMHACDEQRALFRFTWGDQVEVTVDEFVKHAQEFSWTWGASNLLSAIPGERFEDDVDEYQAARQRAVSAERGKLDQIPKWSDDGEITPEWQAASEAFQNSRREGERQQNEYEARLFAQLYIEDDLVRDMRKDQILAHFIAAEDREIRYLQLKKEKDDEAKRIADADAVPAAQANAAGESSGVDNSEKPKGDLDRGSDRSAAPLVSGASAAPLGGDEVR